MKNFEELSFEEMQRVEGVSWPTILRWLDLGAKAIGVYDAVSDFQEGWNSH